MKFRVDRRIYPDAVLSKVIYWLSEKFIITRVSQDDNYELISLKSLYGQSEDEIEYRFWSALNDFKLRDIVAKETRDIKTILYAKAFAEDDGLTEEDIQ